MSKGGHSNLICTPNHVIANIEEAKACTVEFDAEEHPMHAGVAKIPFEVIVNGKCVLIMHIIFEL
jgi:hypothetical protein